MRIAAIIIIALTAIMAGCNAEDESRSPSTAPREAPGLSAEAQKELMARPNVQQVHCSSRLPFVKHAVDVHATLDLRAYPQRACVVELRDGGKVDYLRIRGQWSRVRR
jgi:hypothetical protein